MGTDIHMAVEVQNATNNTWHCVQPQGIEPCWSCQGKGVNVGAHFRSEFVGKPCSWCASRSIRGTQARSWWHDRDYTVFAVLADVRNGSGFAGSKLHEPLRPIAMPRGLPMDLSPELQAERMLSSEVSEARYEATGAHGWNWDHTPTWLLLSEILAYDWAQENQRFGVVSWEVFKSWPGAEPPKEYSGDVFGGDTEIVSNAEMIHRITAGNVHRGLYTRVAWTETLEQRCKGFLTWARGLSAEVDAAPERVRLVFGFDS